MFCTVPSRAAKAAKISYTGTTSPTNQSRKDRFHMYSLSPHLQKSLILAQRAQLTNHGRTPVTVQQQGGRLELRPPVESSDLDEKVLTSNGNNIETKRNHTSIIGVFSVSKRNEPRYSKIFWIEEKTNIISLRPCSIEAKRTDLIKIYAGSNKNVLDQSKTLQNQSKANVISPYTNKIEEKTKFSLQKDRSESKPCQSQTLQDRRENNVVQSNSRYHRSKANQVSPKLREIESQTSRIALNFTGSNRDRRELYRSLGSIGIDFICRRSKRRLTYWSS